MIIIGVDICKYKHEATLIDKKGTIIGKSIKFENSIVSDIGDISRFSHASKLVAYSGIDPTVKQSGEFCGTQNKMSKRGSPFLRRAIWTAVVAAFNDLNLNEYYLKKKAEGKHHGTIIGAIARKLIYRIFIILRDNVPYIC